MGKCIHAKVSLRVNQRVKNGQCLVIKNVPMSALVINPYSQLQKGFTTLSHRRELCA